MKSQSKSKPIEHVSSVNTAKLIHEIGALKLVKRSGWWLAGIKDPESVAEHSHRAACIGYILARMEKADAEKVMTRLLFHDLPETRLNDMHKVGRRYLDSWSSDQEKALKEQLACLPDDLAGSILDALDSNIKDKSKEGIIAKDADLLECAFTAKEYMETGYSECQDWIDNVGIFLRTKSARSIFDAMKTMKSTDWWHGLKKLER